MVKEKSWVSLVRNGCVCVSPTDELEEAPFHAGGHFIPTQSGNQQAPEPFSLHVCDKRSIVVRTETDLTRAAIDGKWFR